MMKTCCSISHTWPPLFHQVFPPFISPHIHPSFHLSSRLLLPGEGGCLGTFLSRIHNHLSTWGGGWRVALGYLYVCVSMLFSVILLSIHLAISSSFFITGLRSVISLQSDKAVISPVEKSHNRSEIFGRFGGNYQILPFNSAGSSVWSVEMRKNVAWTCFNWFLDDFHVNCEIVVINRKDSI